MHVSRFTYYVRNTFRMNATSWQFTVPAPGQQLDSLSHDLVRRCFLYQIKLPTVRNHYRTGLFKYYQWLNGILQFAA